MTKNSIALNRTLFLEDNLPVLRGLDSEIIDLSIATDPPFNKDVRAFEGATKAGVDIEHKGVWHWGDVQEKWVADIEGDHPRLYNVIRAANSAAGDDMDNLTLLCDPCNRLKSNKPTLHELCIARADEGRMGKGWYEEENWK